MKFFKAFLCSCMVGTEIDYIRLRYSRDEVTQYICQ